jgi:integrase
VAGGSLMSTAETMVTRVEDYLLYRRNLGFELSIAGGQLLDFARFADGAGHQGALTLDLIVSWATQPGTRQRQFPGRRIEVVRPFARYCAAFDPASTVPSRGLLGPPRRRPLHHIFTDSEIVELMDASGHLEPVGELRPATYVALFGLLAACGLRISEALHLNRQDVDLDHGLLHIRATKFRKSRLVPLHPSTSTALGAFAEIRDRAAPPAMSSTFFTSVRGGPLPYSTVRNVFRRLLAILGWDARVPRPRIHDIRHAFACRCLQRWYDEGVEIAPRVATLATYMGHAKVSDTYWYLTGTPELLARAAARFEAFAAKTMEA